jgi:hypothetical protein
MGFYFCHLSCILKSQYVFHHHVNIWKQFHSIGNSFIVYVVGRDAQTKEAMRVFGASVHSKPTIPNLGLP